MATSKDLFSFYFHDYETFGTHPAYDRPVQFAGIRTDSDFNIIDEPTTLYCKPADDYLPTPEAVLITGITPQYALAHGTPEAIFARHIYEKFSQPDSCILGYNNIRFDDEVTRHLFYRNFIDPYAYSWQNNNSRWDLIDMVRACYALRPDGINWPLNDQGTVSFKLEALSAANHLEHQQAHDAMSDVYATIGLAKLIKEKQPKLFDYLFKLRNKHKVTSLIDTVKMTPLVHVSGMFSGARAHTSLVSPICWHPSNKNAVIVADLCGDITPLLSMSAEAITQRLYLKNDDLNEGENRIPLKLIHINKCPVIAPLSTLLAETEQRLQLDKHHALHQWQQLISSHGLRDKINRVFERDNIESVFSSHDVDGQLYQQFAPQSDRSLMPIIQDLTPEQLSITPFQFTDARFPELLFRYRARNFFNTLNEVEQRRWMDYRKQRFTPEYLNNYFTHLNELTIYYQNNEQKLTLLQKILQYCQWLLQ